MNEFLQFRQPMLLEDLIPMPSTQYQKENMPFQVFYLPLLALNITTDFESKIVNFEIKIVWICLWKEFSIKWIVNVGMYEIV